MADIISVPMLVGPDIESIYDTKYIKEISLFSFPQNGNGRARFSYQKNTFFT
jgi:hypothetical protein